MEQEIFLEKGMIIVSETDTKGNILYANSDFCKICGYDKDELIGKAHNIVRHRDMPKAAFKALWETIQTGESWNGIVKNRTKENGFYWVNATIFSSKDVDGNLRYISVRIKPTQEEVDNAQALYKTLV
ncbi:MAG: PAS domain-containing protein [Campylobacterota bacterium]|nr:PAS domain-containing protein [Campylobacterota bacterium]